MISPQNGLALSRIRAKREYKVFTLRKMPKVITIVSCGLK